MKLKTYFARLFFGGKPVNKEVVLVEDLKEAIGLVKADIKEGYGFKITDHSFKNLCNSIDKYL